MGEVAAHQRGGEGPHWVHRRTANWSGPQSGACAILELVRLPLVKQARVPSPANVSAESEGASCLGSKTGASQLSGPCGISVTIKSRAAIAMPSVAIQTS